MRDKAPEGGAGLRREGFPSASDALPSVSDEEEAETDETEDEALEEEDGPGRLRGGKMRASSRCGPPPRHAQRPSWLRPSLTRMRIPGRSRNWAATTRL